MSSSSSSKRTAATKRVAEDESPAPEQEPATKRSAVICADGNGVEVAVPVPSSTPTLVHVQDLSENPTADQLLSFVDSAVEELPAKYRRALEDRIFVNRDLRLEDIKWFGFDMDYTLAVYHAPVYEELSFELTKQRLVKMGYPEIVMTFTYDHTFPVRGLHLDLNTGNLLKIDQFGYILRCVHGRKIYNRAELRGVYPAGQINTPEIGRRYHQFNTLFEIPEISLWADLITYLEGEMVGASSSGVHAGEVAVGVSYKNVFADLRGAVDAIHADGSLKGLIINNLTKYVRRDPRLPQMLHRMRTAGKKLFLATNSEYYYTNAVMDYMLRDMHPQYPTWRDYFDVIIVNAKKPLFFEKGTTLREVDLATGNLKFSKIGDSFIKGRVYNGGNYTTFHELTKCKGEEVLYCGDNLVADIQMSKKNMCLWRTMFVLRELDHETMIWSMHHDKYTHLQNLEYIRAKMYRYYNIDSLQPPENATLLKQMIKDTMDEFDTAFNRYFGSIFRSGSKPTHFSTQTHRYADIYASDFLHLMNYPLFYYFSSPSHLLCHENEARLYKTLTSGDSSTSSPAAPGPSRTPL